MLTIIFVVEVASEVAEMVSVSEPNSLRVVFEAFRMMFCGVEPPELLPEPLPEPLPESLSESLPPPSQLLVDSHEPSGGKSTS